MYFTSTPAQTSKSFKFYKALEDVIYVAYMIHSNWFYFERCWMCLDDDLEDHLWRVQWSSVEFDREKTSNLPHEIINLRVNDFCSNE